MKTALVAINSKYIHSTLALRYIKAYCKDLNTNIYEFSINDNILSVYGELISKNANIYCFSCYIWNIEFVLKISKMLKSVNENIKIVLGGPESAYNTKEIFEKNDFIDYIICGEGEKPTFELIDALENNKNTENILGVATKNNFYPKTELLDLSTVSFPYSNEDMKELENKIIYFETSRGCPFGCTYCLSSEDRKVRYFPMDYVKSGFEFFFSHNVPLVKLVDRTFNANNKRAVEILEFIINNSKTTSVHLEIEPHMLNEELTNVLISAPKGMFNLEIGIQTINEKTLSAINRKADLDVISSNLNKLIKNNNMHIHLDLIAGLPYEDKKSFEKSFNYVYSLKPHMLQLGFLKVLHGTKMENEKGIIYESFPPYEVLKTPWISHEELISLKKTENAVDKILNSGAFLKTVEKLTRENPFAFFENTGEKLYEKYNSSGISKIMLYDFLFELYGDEIYNEIVYDFLINNQNNKLPKFVQRDNYKNFKEMLNKFVNSKEYAEKYGFINDFKKIRIEPISKKVYLCNYENKTISDITKDFMIIDRVKELLE